MNIYVNYKAITNLLSQAKEQKRNFLKAVTNGRQPQSH